MKIARVGAVVLAGSLCLFVAGCCCGGGAGRHGGGPSSREPVAEREPAGSPSLTRQLQDLDDAYRRRLISRDEFEAARQRILGEPGGISRR